MNATYFVRIDTYWQNSPDRFVGPFASRSEAQAEIDRALQGDNKVYSASELAGDIRDGVRVFASILSKTEARKAGLRDYTFGDDASNLLGTTIPDNTSALKEIEDYEPSFRMGR